MKYYTIQNNNILIAENEQALSNYYNNVKVLPDDYTNGKYIIDNNDLIINPNFEAEQAEKEKQSRILKIKQQLNELDTKRIRAMCEPSVCENDPEKTWLDFYNEQAQALRAELKELEERTENDDNIEK